MDQSTDLIPFQIPGEGFDLRVLLLDGEPWFVAADVARVLGYRDASHAVRVLKSGEKRPHLMGTPGGQQEILLISEPGFYRLVMRSNRPEADAFQTWVTAEVLPSIRKTGGYGVQPALPQSLPEALRAYADEIVRRESAEVEMRAAHEQRIEAVSRAAILDAQVEQARPKLAAYDDFLNLTGLLQVAEAAQALGTGQIRLYSYLRQHGVLISGGHRHNHPKQGHIDTQRFDLKETGEYVDSKGNRVATFTTMVTPKGLDYIRRLINKHGRSGL